MRTVQHILKSKQPVHNTIEARTTVFDALNQLVTVDLSYLVVKDGESFQGVFSERDYSRNVILKGRSSKETTVADVMSTNLPKVQLSHTLEQCINTLLQNKTRYLLAFDDKNQFAGVITIHDLLRQIIANKEESFDHSAMKQLIDQDESSRIY